MDKNWKLLSVDNKEVELLQSQLAISKSICEILVRRGIKNFDQAKAFFRPQISDLHDPFLMKGMHKAVERVSKAINKNENICIFGDYDVDGTMSVSVLYDFFRKYLIQDSSLYYYLPDRNKEGYGLSFLGIDYAHENNCTLMIVADCGIKDVEKIKYACEVGIDVIVLDHHIPGATLPPAYAIINPQQSDCTYPYSELSACGLVYKFVSALKHVYAIQFEQEHEYLDWTTLSIASDIVPMTGENRTLAFLGLKKIIENPSKVVQIFKNKLSLENRQLSIADLVFKIGPKINASGRISHASEVVKLFTSDNYEFQEEQIQKLFSDNTDRQYIDQSMTQEIFERLEMSFSEDQRSIVVFHPKWHKGILGIVASRIVEKYYRPTIVLTESNDVIVGSARSVHGFDLYHSLERCREHLIQFGGHAFAAGMTIKKEQLASFKEAFEVSVRDHISEDSLVPVIEADVDVQLDELSIKYAKIIQQFEPCGPKNAMPIFIIRKLYDTGYSKVVKEVHAQLFLSHNPKNTSSKRVKGIAFHMGEWIDYIKSGKAIDIICHIEIDTWNGNENISLRILDIKASK